MKSQAKNLKKAFGDIRNVLFNAWDPIGVNSNSKLSDEYDSYIAGIYRLLVDGAKHEALASHLTEIETAMGLPGCTDHARLLIIVEKLKAVNLKL